MFDGAICSLEWKTDPATTEAGEGVHLRALEQKANIPTELPSESAANFHCSPAATIREDGSFNMGAVTATARFRFAKWLPEWMARTGAKPIIDKGGMGESDDRRGESIG